VSLDHCNEDNSISGVHTINKLTTETTKGKRISFPPAKLFPNKQMPKQSAPNQTAQIPRVLAKAALQDCISLRPIFVPAQRVGLAIKLPSASSFRESQSKLL